MAGVMIAATGLGWTAPGSGTGEGIVEILLVPTPSGASLFTLDRRDGWLLRWAVGADGTLSPLEGTAAQASAQLAGGWGLSWHQGGSGAGPVVGGISANALHHFQLAADGSLPAGSVSLAPGQGAPAPPIELVDLGDGSGRVAARMVNAAEMVVFDPADGGPGTTVAPWSTPAALGLTDIAIAHPGGTGVLLAVSADADAVATVDPASLAVKDEIGAPDGLGVADPAALAVLDRGGGSLVFMAASGSSTISGFRLDGDGNLQLVEHVMDDAGSGFGGATRLALAESGAKAFLAASGTDPAVQLFAVLPGGELVGIGAVTDDVAGGLSGVTDIALLPVDAGLELVVAGAGGAGLGRWRIDLSAGDVLEAPLSGGKITAGAGDDWLIGSAEADTLEAGAGDDILFDGPGPDTLAPGPGADTIVLVPDQMPDVVVGFEPGLDRLDLSRWQGFASASQPSVVQTAEGAEVSLGSESLTLRSASGQPLDESEVRAAIIGLPRQDVGELSGYVLTGDAADNLLTGGAGADLLRGGDGADRLRGEGGDDRIEGGLGPDLLNGGDGNDNIIGGPADGDLADQIYAGVGDDKADGGAGNDRIYGMEGNDSLVGGWGEDMLAGQDGDDSLSGGPWSDELHGGGGNDFLNGGYGFDRLNGGAGADRFFHAGVAGHGSDWIQDYHLSEGDVLLLGLGAGPEELQVNLAETAGAGQAGVAEAFVIYRPTGQILWALVDGAAEPAVHVEIAGTGTGFDLPVG